jgi:hypothetical protein
MALLYQIAPEEQNGPIQSFFPLWEAGKKDASPMVNWILGM